MIARIWRGVVPTPKADAYLHLMRTVALPDYGTVAGNLGAYCLRRRDGDVAEFQMMTLWADMDAIRQFAGPDAERAKYYGFDPEFLIDMEPAARHFEAFSS